MVYHLYTQGLPAAKQNLIERSPEWLNLSSEGEEDVQEKEGCWKDLRHANLGPIRGKTVAEKIRPSSELVVCVVGRADDAQQEQGCRFLFVDVVLVSSQDGIARRAGQGRHPHRTRKVYRAFSFCSNSILLFSFVAATRLGRLTGVHACYGHRIRIFLHLLLFSCPNIRSIGYLGVSVKKRPVGF